MNRRDALKAVGAAGAMGLVGAGVYSATFWQVADDAAPDDELPAIQRLEQRGQTDLPADAHATDIVDDPVIQRHAHRFNAIVNAVNVGADPDGDQPITPVLDQYAVENTLLSFPGGTYRVDPVAFVGRRNIGLVGVGEEETRLVPTNGHCRVGHPYIHFDGVADLTLDNITFDFRDEEGGGPIHFFLHGDSVVRKCSYLGTCQNQIATMRVEVPDEDGIAEFHQLEARNVDDDYSLTGVYVSDGHAGEAVFRQCAMTDFSDNGLYASAPGGPGGANGVVHVVSGQYRNNNIANVRLGSTGASATDVTVVVDEPTPGSGQLNARGIRLRNQEEQIIDDCELRYTEDAATSFGAIVFHAENGGALVRDTHIKMDRNTVPAIRAFPAREQPETAPVFEGVQIDGSAANGVTADIEGRDGTAFVECTIEQLGPNRAGIELVNCDDCHVIDSHIETTTGSILLRNADVTIENTTLATPDAEHHVEYETFADQEVHPRELE